MYFEDPEKTLPGECWIVICRIVEKEDFQESLVGGPSIKKQNK